MLRVTELYSFNFVLNSNTLALNYRFYFVDRTLLRSVILRVIVILPKSIPYSFVGENLIYLINCLGEVFFF